MPALPPDEVDAEFKKIKRRLQHARREIIKAVERMAEIDPRPGHIAEARRRALQVREAADDLIEALERRER